MVLTTGTRIIDQSSLHRVASSDKGTLGDVKFKKIKFLQKIKEYIVRMTTVFFFIGGG